MDLFPSQVKFTFNKGQTTFGTKAGGIISVILVTLVTGYAVWMAVEMIMRTKSNIQTHYDYQVYDEKFEFGKDRNFTFAFRMTKALDPDYGNLVVAQNTKDFNGLKTNLIPYRPCTPNDFNIISELHKK